MDFLRGSERAIRVRPAGAIIAFEEARQKKEE